MQFCLSLHTQLHRTSCPFPNTTHAKIEMRVVPFFRTNKRTLVFRLTLKWFIFSTNGLFPLSYCFQFIVQVWEIARMFQIEIVNAVAMEASMINAGTMEAVVINAVAGWWNHLIASNREQAWCYGKRNSTILYNIETLREILSERSVQFSWKLWIKTSLTLIQPKQTN